MNGASFHRDLHKDLKADYILANPPFNDSDWGGARLREDARWKFGVPPVGNANFAWVQHFLHHLSPAGVAGFVLANGSLSSQQSGEGEIRKAIVEADLVDCIGQRVSPRQPVRPSAEHTIDASCDDGADTNCDLQRAVGDNPESHR